MNNPTPLLFLLVIITLILYNFDIFQFEIGQHSGKTLPRSWLYNKSAFVWNYDLAIRYSVLEDTGKFC